MPNSPASDLPLALFLDIAAVSVQGHKLAPINTGTITTNVVLQNEGDDAENNVAAALAVLQTTLFAAPVAAQRKADLMAFGIDIAQTLKEAAPELRAGRISYGHCGALRGHADRPPVEAAPAAGRARREVCLARRRCGMPSRGGAGTAGEALRVRRTMKGHR